VYDFVNNSEQNLIVMDLLGKNLDSSKSGQLNLVMRFEDMNDDEIKLCSSFLLFMIILIIFKVITWQKSGNRLKRVTALR
jgi:hypothetical protein